MCFIIERECRCCMAFMRIPNEVLEQMMIEGREDEAIEHCGYCMEKCHNMLHPITKSMLRRVENEQVMQS